MARAQGNSTLLVWQLRQSACQQQRQQQPQQWLWRRQVLVQRRGLVWQRRGLVWQRRGLVQRRGRGQGGGCCAGGGGNGIATHPVGETPHRRGSRGYERSNSIQAPCPGSPGGHQAGAAGQGHCARHGARDASAAGVAGAGGTSTPCILIAKRRQAAPSGLGLCPRIARRLGSGLRVCWCTP